MPCLPLRPPTCCLSQGFYVRAVPSRFNAGVLTIVEAKDLVVRAGVAFTIGLRLFYLFIVVVGGSAVLRWCMVRGASCTGSSWCADPSWC